mmetsp:Transcript_123262/g.354176  ORF Transcript_123262/g.354176 Transcript_123262/m.354176 type:complete len:495 (+) Transcript_123262:3-1487(+)
MRAHAAPVPPVTAATVPAVSPASPASPTAASPSKPVRSGVGVGVPTGVCFGSSAQQAQASPQAISFGGGASSNGIAIQARDATCWWNNAAARWAQSTSSLKLGGSSEAGTPQRAAKAFEDEVVSQEQDGDEQASDEDQHEEAEEEGDQADLDDEPIVEAEIIRPEEEKVVDVKLATPGTAPRAACSPSPRPSGCKKIMTPSTASPRGLRLNSKEEVCGICCNDVPPCRAVRLACSHGWYCAQCILRHAEARLATGATSITCPECCTPLAERDLRKLLPQELIDRLLSRSLEQAVSSTADLFSCPTPNCPMRVALEEGELGRLKCTLCNKTSCLRCGLQPFHRGLTCEEARKRRVAAGNKRKRDEGFDSLMKWIEETGTKQCPTCRMAVTKQKLENQNTQYSECHKMCCRNCGTKFCFKCLAVLSDNYTCGCTINAHGFIDPHSGKRINHLRRGAAKAKGKAKAGGDASTAAGSGAAAAKAIAKGKAKAKGKSKK